MERDPALPISSHLRELRRRLVISIAAIAVGFGLCYAWAEPLFGLLLQPLIAVLPPERGELMFSGLTEPFVVYLKTGLLGGVFLAMPVIFMQIWLFIRPAFRGQEERYATVFVVFGSLLFVTGAAFGYFLVFPFGFGFLIGFGTADFVPLLSIGEYFSLATKMLFAFGMMFETPLVLLFLGRLGVIDAAWLRRNRRYAIVVLFVTAALLTPPDIITQAMLVAPLMLLYEASIWLVRVFGKSRIAAPETDAESA